MCFFKKEFGRIILELNQTFNFLGFKMAQIQTEIQKEITNNPQLFSLTTATITNQQFEEKLHK